MAPSSPADESPPRDMGGDIDNLPPDNNKPSGSPRGGGGGGRSRDDRSRSRSPRGSRDRGSRRRRSRSRSRSRGSHRRSRRGGSRSRSRSRSYDRHRDRRSRSPRSRSRSRSRERRRDRDRHRDRDRDRDYRDRRGPHGPPPDYYRGGRHDRDYGPPPPGYFGGPPPPGPGFGGGDFGGPPPGGGGRRGRRGRGHDEGPPGVSLLIRNVSPDISTQDLQMAFGRIGEVRDVYIPRDFHSQQPKGFAFIEYATPQMASEARDEMDKFLMKGRELEVVYAQEKRKTPTEMRGRVVDGRADRGSRGGGGGGGRGGEDFQRSSSFERHKKRERERESYFRPEDAKRRD